MILEGLESDEPLLSLATISLVTRFMLAFEVWPLTRIIASTIGRPARIIVEIFFVKIRISFGGWPRTGPGDFGVEAGLGLRLDLGQHDLAEAVLPHLLLCNDKGFGFDLALFLLALELGLVFELLHRRTLENQNARIFGNAEYTILDETARDFLHRLEPVLLGRGQKLGRKRFLEDGLLEAGVIRSTS